MTDHFRQSRTPADRLPPQWRLSTLLFVMTLAAIGLAGWAKLGLGGAFGMLFAAWLGVISVVGCVQSLRNRSGGWMIGLFAALVFGTLAIAMILVIAIQPK